ncbi:MAG: TetR family transcriptional regulator [Micromonosporaceae bacterium]|nr:TetR family transcriptional regulator [Micromonosporaceae bacterium]
MPRVSDAHREARREQILAAARRCFARNGFHATSMQDVIAEAGLSVGAVYRYFTGKDELRTAVAEENVGALIGALSAVTAYDPPLPLAEAMVQVVDVVEARLAEPDSIARIGIQAWGEAVRDPALGEFVAGTLRGMRDTFITLARRAGQAGELPPGTDPEAAGAVLMAILPGFVLQRVLTGGPDAATFAAGLRALLPANPAGA